MLSYRPGYRSATTGYPMTNVRVVLFDGKMHPVDSNDISFKIAGMMAFREAFLQAEPQLLEPVYELDVLVPATVLGDVMTELQIRRGVILNMETENEYQVIKARTPLAELDKLLSAWRDAQSGPPAVVLISGEAGIGKTSLVEHYVQMQATHWRQLWGACDDLFTPRPLGPLHDIAGQRRSAPAAHRGAWRTSRAWCPMA